ncbi:DNA cytosine methyltransferase [Flavobacterium tructae]|uniref:DNA (cytosine-5-)-methyltransferase n=1 Tax=Flavobacterium tructae TaxID=1114873 RepID=A0A1S1J5M4_9FLAO|nr:DNA methyltransferase [Flavobacterium tructae]OXB19549.1 DNA cytosine methyltransferase [Flavobacterium tructae]
MKKHADSTSQLVFWIDLFCGAGGTSTGIHFTDIPNMFVAACVNHDSNAILSHAQNHPDTLHFTEDIRDFKVVIKLKFLVDSLRIAFPDCRINIWASLECTNFSKAKGGQARDADSRTLAEHMFMYLVALDPDYFWVENVREFMCWGPLDEKGKPVSRTAGRDYIHWLNKVCSHGYKYDSKILNAADFGAYQSRERLFIQFAKEFKSGLSFKSLPIAWPEQTHTKDKVESTLFPMEKWKPVREVLELEDEGVSIFERKKELSDNTLKRIYAGLLKFVANGDEVFTKRYNGGKINPHQKVNSIEKPMGTICTNVTHALVKSVFLKKYYSGRPEGKVIGIDGPAGTIKTVDGHAIVTASHLNTYYGNGGVHSIDNPCPTLTTKDRVAKVDINFIDQQYGNSLPTDIDSPIGALTQNPKFALVKTKPWIMDTNFNNVGKSVDEPAATILACRKYPYLVKAQQYIFNPAWGGNNGSIENPCCTVVARQDKAPLYLVSTELGQINIPVYESDSETMILIKKFMVSYGVIDIKMRMLNIPELKQIQGFPKDYKLIGTQTEQKKFIGNAVEVNQAKALVKNNYRLLQQHSMKIAV